MLVLEASSKQSSMYNSAGHSLVGVHDNVDQFFWIAIVSMKFPEGVAVYAVECLFIIYEANGGFCSSYCLMMM